METIYSWSDRIVLFSRMISQDHTLNHSTTITVPRWVVYAVILLWFSPPLLARHLLGNWEEAGKFGDSFGVVTSLFSGLALLGVVYTIWQQRIDSLTAEHSRIREQEFANRQLYQLALSVQLQSARALIAEHRRAITLLNPAIGEVPAAPSQLAQLKASIARDATSNASLRKHEPEIIERLTELEELQKEIGEIRLQIRNLGHSSDVDG